MMKDIKETYCSKYASSTSFVSLGKEITFFFSQDFLSPYLCIKISYKLSLLHIMLNSINVFEV